MLSAINPMLPFLQTTDDVLAFVLVITKYIQKAEQGAEFNDCIFFLFMVPSRLGCKGTGKSKLGICKCRYLSI